MKTIPMSQFGRDHWSVFAYIETLCVDNKGVPDHDRMRTNPKTHPGLVGPRIAIMKRSWKPEYGSRLRGHAIDKPVQRLNHDDWDCADDLVAAGLIESNGTGINPWFTLTKTGLAIAAALRQHKASGGSFSNFTP
jgi:hypothetical protein